MDAILLNIMDDLRARSEKSSKARMAA
jgi:hypothetical protein